MSSRRSLDAYGTFDKGSPRHRDDASTLEEGEDKAIAVPARAVSSHGVSIRKLGLLGLIALTASAVFLQRDGAVANTNDTDPLLDLSKVKHRLEGVEERFVANVKTSKLREFLLAYASLPHSAGTKQDYQTALYTAQQFESFGFKADIKTYYTLLSTPVRRRLSIVSPASAAHELNLTEATVSGGACSSNEDALPPFLAYSPSGNVTAPVIYVNFGMQADYDALATMNVSLEGKIALVRYGGNFRGLKVWLAQQHAMAGVLIYSDPSQDGFVNGPTYPQGPWRPSNSFQRGSLEFLSVASGDPLTPGFPSTLDAPYLSMDEVDTIPKIPALPLSYEQASHILRSLGGTPAPAAWHGSLNLPHGYMIGDDAATVLNLDLEMDNSVGPIWDVIGTIKGDREPQEEVLIGNHRDVCGAIDPSSGTATMLEVARGFGELLKRGWKPRRTIKMGSWDGEEYGLLGSTEYAEDHADHLTRHAVAYINVDHLIGPFVTAAGSPSIAAFLMDTAKAIPAHAGATVANASTLYDQWTAQAELRRVQTNGRSDDRTLGPEHLISFLGSGTDYTPFYQHLGIVSAHLQFNLANAASGVYHSAMDSVVYLESYGDPQYETLKTTAQWWGLLTLRLADSRLLPFDFTSYAGVMQDDLTKLESQINKSEVDFQSLRASISHFGAQAELLQARIRAAALQQGHERWLNEKMMHVEQQLLQPEGLPHRPWFKHVVFGPGVFEGYAGTAFPGIADAIAFHDDVRTTQMHVDAVARMVAQAAEYMVAAE